MGKYTKADIRRIANAMRRQKEDVSDRPYSLMIGAGCSKSAGIPLASELVKEIKSKYEHEIKHRLGADCDDDYGACMGVLSAYEIRNILTPYLQNSGVNWGHIGVAALMAEGYVGRVLTFNFDSVLARACGLLGLYPATYDFATGAPTRTNFIVSPAILHLHGQGHGHALLNSADETREIAKALRLLLNDTLSRHPLLVAGYSGESDAIFEVLEEVFEGEQRLCWAGYETDCPPHIQKLISKREGSSEYIGEADADQFFVDLATELGCWPPELFTNPYAHLINELKPVVDYPGPDTDILSETRAELKIHADSADAERDTAHDLFMKGDFEGVVSLLGENPETDEDRQILGYALMRMANNLGEQILLDYSDDLCEKMLRLYSDASRYLKDDYGLYFNWGRSLAKLAELNNNLDFYRQSVKKCTKAVQIKPDSHNALNNLGNALLALARETQDTKLFKESFEKYAKAIEINPEKHETYYNWGNALCDHAEQTQDTKLFKESFKKYAKAIEIKPDKHEAYQNWGNALIALAEQTQDPKLFKESSEKYAKAIEIKPDDPGILNNWGNALLSLAEQTQDTKLFKESFKKYAKAIEIKPDKHESYQNLSTALLTSYNLTHEADLLVEAERVLEDARHLKPDKLYNIACLYARQDKPGEAIDALLHCESKGTLPSGGRAHLEADTDIDSLRDHPEFKALLARLATTEESDT